jgi:hypothetical protein
VGRLAVAVAASVFLALAGASAASAARVAIFFYPWYGTPKLDGSYQKWDQNGHDPPGDVYSPYYPARGAYSSSNATVLDRQMADIAGAGIDEVVVSWWGRGSPTDDRLTAVMAAAHKHRLQVAIHIEPYGGRTIESVAGDIGTLALRGVHDFYVFHAEDIPSAEWASLRPTLPHVRLFAQTGLVGFASAGRFDGVYTYDIMTFGGQKLGRLCREARRLGLLCAPSVGPGYDALHADGDEQIKPRLDGATYDAMWKAALRAHPDLVSITSYNEWGEGTQIEPARPHFGYLNYNGAFGMKGRAADRAYLVRTAYWTHRAHRPRRD